MKELLKQILSEALHYFRITIPSFSSDGPYRGENPFAFAPIPPNGCEPELLVENSGRINYVFFIGKEKEGTAEGVCPDFQQQIHWESVLFSMDSPAGLSFVPFTGDASPATFYRCAFEPQAVREVFLKHPDSKGGVRINGFSLGCYGKIGSAETLCITTGTLRCGTNELIVFEQERLANTEAEFSPSHELGVLEAI